MTTVNYSNRQIDISLFPAKNSDKIPLLGLRPSPMVITGKLKASQNYLRVLLSSAGERKENSNFGSNLFNIFKTSNISYPIQIIQNFSIQNLLVLKWFKERYNKQTPIDEKIRKVDLLNYNIQPGGQIILELKLHTEAGETEDIHLPVKWQKT